MNSKFINIAINSEPENIEQEDRTELRTTDITRHIKVVTLLLLFLAKLCFRVDLNNSLKRTALTNIIYYIYCSLIITLLHELH